MKTMNKFLESSIYIDWNHPDVLAKARALAEGIENKEEVAKACFEFVRDDIKHSWDYKLNPVTCAASDVLKHGTGFCYAKSHLLAALLRANNIPAGLCYQRLTTSDNKPPFCLHGLNAIFLEPHGWYRVDARGNRLDVNAQFCPPTEQLAFPIITQGEADLPEIWPEPLSVIVQSLESNRSYLELAINLPDVDLIG